MKNFSKKILSKMSFKTNENNLNWKTILSTSLLFFLVAIFAFSGTISNFTKGDNWIMKINGEYIGKKEFENKLKKLKNNDDYIGYDELKLKRELASKLAMEKTLELEAKDLGYNIDNEFIINIVKNNKKFYKEEKFSTELFKDFLLKYNINEDDYFHSIKIKLLEDLIMSNMEKIVTIDKNLAEIVSRSRNQTRVYDLYKLDLSKIKIDEKEITENELSEFFNKNKDQFELERFAEVEYIDLKEISSKIKYIPLKNDILEIKNRYPNLKEDQIKDLLIDLNLCKISNSIISNASNKNSTDTLLQISSTYNIKIKSKKININQKQTKYKEIINMEKNSFYINRYGQKCQDVEIFLIKNIDQSGYKSYNDVKSEIKKILIKEKRRNFAENISKELENKLNIDSYIKSLQNLKDNSFISTQGLKTIRIVEKFNNIDLSDDLLEQIFLTDAAYFTKLTKIDDTFAFAFVREIVNTNEKDKENKITTEKMLHRSKVYDLYYIYYSYLQKKYSVELNNIYFGGDFIK